MGSDEISIRAPANCNEAPPGHYMLFILTGELPNRVPSKARMVKLSTGSGDDCNMNGTSDECDISSGSSEDCDGNGVPDECELTLHACCTPLVGTCSSQTRTDCETGGGVFDCNSSCNDPTGPCCLPSGACVDGMTQACCSLEGGIWKFLGANDCASIWFCPPIFGPQPGP